MSCRRQRSARAFSPVFVEPSPLRPVVDPLLVDDEPTVLADDFDCVGSDPAVAFGALVRAGVSLCVFVECRLVDVSGCHGTHEGIYAARVSRNAPHALRGTYTSHGPALPPMGCGGESPTAWFENRRFSSSRKSDALSNDNGAQRRELPGPWRWWEVAVTAYTPAKKRCVAPAIRTTDRALGIH